jgi:hypothetical protein
MQLQCPPETIKCGTSGSPAFDDEGRVVGILTQSSDNESLAHVVRLATALPGYMLKTLDREWTALCEKQITAAMERSTRA